MWRLFSGANAVPFGREPAQFKPRQRYDAAFGSGRRPLASLARSGIGTPGALAHGVPVFTRSLALDAGARIAAASGAVDLGAFSAVRVDPAGSGHGRRVARRRRATLRRDSHRHSRRAGRPRSDVLTQIRPAPERASFASA
jgi:hypothetical protein